MQRQAFSGALKSGTYRTNFVRLIRVQHVSGWNAQICGEKWESAGKPGSVVGNHSSGMHVTVHLEQPTRKHARAARCSRKAACFPIWPCSRWGLPCRRRYRRRGALLPHPFTLAVVRKRTLGRFAFCCTFRGLAPPRYYLAPCPVEPGLSSAFRWKTAVAWPTPAGNIGALGRVFKRHQLSTAGQFERTRVARVTA